MSRSDRFRRVVVTGGSGRVGRYVLAELCHAFDVVNADLVRPPTEDWASFQRTDVMALDEVRAALTGADAVVHLAALDYDWGARPEDYVRVNYVGSWHVLQAAVELGVERVVLCSSVAATGLTEMRSDWAPQSLPIDERHDCRPVHAYGLSKQTVELAALSVARGSAVDVICVRPVAVVMEETFSDYLRFIDTPDLRWLFYYVTAEDLARGFRLALESPAPHYGVLLFGADDSSLDVPTLDWYRERVGPLPELCNPRRYLENPRASVFSNAKAREVLGWEPTTDFVALRRSWDTDST